jgi:hypothetical protein
VAYTVVLLRLLVVCVFAVAAVWFVAFNGAFVSDGAFLDGHEGRTLVAICLCTSLLHLLLNRGWRRRPIQAAATAALLGVGLPILAVVVPVGFCLLFECAGFYFP